MVLHWGSLRIHHLASLTVGGGVMMPRFNYLQFLSPEERELRCLREQLPICLQTPHSGRNNSVQQSINFPEPVMQARHHSH